MATIAYYGNPISPNIVEIPNDGTIVCRNAVIARTGYQVYKGRDVMDELRKIGISASPDDDITVYRSPEEVFSKATIASFEGKPVTDGHPYTLLDRETIRDYQCGHVQNVRKGSKPLANGSWPLVADLVVTDKSLIQKIEAGLRELSCGYNYQLLKDGNRLLQIDIVGNHVAVVPNGRAGPLAAIRDSILTAAEDLAIQRIEKAYLEQAQQAELGRLRGDLAHSLTRRPPATARDCSPRNLSLASLANEVYRQARQARRKNWRDS